jgi:hypothetical protein
LLFVSAAAGDAPDTTASATCGQAASAIITEWYGNASSVFAPGYKVYSTKRMWPSS